MSWNPLRRARERREAELEAVDRWRIARRVADEDVTVLGEQLADLHLDTLTDELDDETAHHYGRALEHYEQAKDVVRTSTTVADVFAVEQVVADARYHRAAVLALRAGDPLPQRREPCFFDPRHGPSMRDMQWAPRPASCARWPCAPPTPAGSRAASPQRSGWCGWRRYVPSHEAGGIEAVVDRYRTMRDERPESHNRKNLAEAYIDQAVNGPDGRFG